MIRRRSSIVAFSVHGKCAANAASFLVTMCSLSYFWGCRRVAVCQQFAPKSESLDYDIMESGSKISVVAVCFENSAGAESFTFHYSTVKHTDARKAISGKSRLNARNIRWHVSRKIPHRLNKLKSITTQKLLLGVFGWQQSLVSQLPEDRLINHCDFRLL